MLTSRGPDGIFVRQTIAQNKIKIAGFMIFDEDYGAYEVACPFCNAKQKIEVFNELMWRGQCSGCHANIGFVFEDDLAEAIMDILDEVELPESKKSGDWELWQDKVAAKKVNKVTYIMFQKL